MDTLSPFLQHYEIDADEVQVELLTAKRVLQGSANKLEFLHHVYNELLPVHECFPKLIQALKIAMTMGVSSASAERSFSSLRRIKTYLRTTMSQERLSNLAFLYVETYQPNFGTAWMTLLLNLHKNIKLVELFCSNFVVHSFLLEFGFFKKCIIFLIGLSISLL